MLKETWEKCVRADGAFNGVPVGGVLGSSTARTVCALGIVTNCVCLLCQSWLNQPTRLHSCETAAFFPHV